MFYQLIETPWGWVAGGWSDKGLAGLTLPKETPRRSLEILETNLKVKAIQEPGVWGENLEEWMVGYFSGRPEGPDIPVDWTGYTPFQIQVLSAARQIPFGRVFSYRQIACMVGKPQAARAVGSALSVNRHLLVVPCHRVIRQNGTPGGFGGRPEYKERLLKWEGVRFSGFE